MSKNQFTGTATQPQHNRKLYQFNKDQYCNSSHIAAMNKPDNSIEAYRATTAG